LARRLVLSYRGSMDRRSRPPVSLDRDFDAAMDLAIQLAILREAHSLDEIVVADLDGTLLTSAGDAEASRALGAFAAAMLKGAPVGTARSFHCGKIHVELVSLAGHPCALAAKASFLVMQPEAISLALTISFAREPEVEAPPSHVDGDDEFEFAWELPRETAAA
jgi:hypothetical protein